MSKQKMIKAEDSIVFDLKQLYESYGYKKFKMSKFEEYDLYVENKNFLISNNVITFNDLNGKLLALKPDVTLSIVKNAKARTAPTEKLYYNENVYRVVEGSREFKEIMQVGLECIGDIDMYTEVETILLAAKSLDCISKNNMICLSHVGFLNGIMDELNIGSSSKEEIVKCINEKNMHDIDTIGARENISKDMIDIMKKLASVYGSFDDNLPVLEKMCVNESMTNSLNELKVVYNALKAAGLADKIQLDFSVVNDLNYYNGVIFKGYIEGIYSSILSGGRYDNLMTKFDKKAGAIGFAVYLNLLEQLSATEKYKVDTLVVYTDDVAIEKVVSLVQELDEQGKSVRVQKCSCDDVQDSIDAMTKVVSYDEVINVSEEG